MSKFLTLDGSMKVAEKKHTRRNRHSLTPFRRNDKKQELIERLKQRERSRKENGRNE